MCDDTKDESATVLAFTKKYDENSDIRSQLNLVIEKTDRCPTRCAMVYVNEKTRTLRCRHCEAVLDPFDWVMARAKDEQQIDWRLTELRREIKDKREGLAKLKIAERNTRARIRTATRKAEGLERFVAQNAHKEN
ncbi:hypothetical protein UXN85_20830 [Enterobacter hormaechei]